MSIQSSELGSASGAAVPAASRADAAASAWLHCLAPRPGAAARLICFHHAGGTAAAYRLWPAGLPEGLEIRAVQLPGRANRLGHPLVRDMAGLTAALVPALLPLLDRPVAFFGHSMGAVLAFETARALQAAGAPLPAHLFLSGRRPPHLPNTEPELRHLSDDAFVTELNRRYNAIPHELLQHRDVLELLLPGLRADIAVLETFRPAVPRPLPCPITALGGEADALTPVGELQAWRDQTRGAFAVRTFAGGHFYLDPRREELLAVIAATLRPLLGAPAPVELVA